jgi:NADH-quinone oxidoreductase subunit H
MVVFLVVGGILLYGLIAVYVERKVAAFIQDRVGPIETGPWGLLQTLADVVKLMRKAVPAPAGRESTLYEVAPLIALSAVCAAVAWFPLWPLQAASPFGLWIAVGIMALETVAIFLGGWSSHSKYALIGAFRLLGLVLSYEVLLGLLLLIVGLSYGTWDLVAIRDLQKNTWGLLLSPGMLIAGILWLLLSFLISHRAPFDLPETESELVAGYLTEYGGMAFGFFMLAEYIVMFLQAYWITHVFLGARWVGLWVPLLIFFQMVVRWAWPRWRPDQAIKLLWKYAIPVAFGAFVLEALWHIA